MMELYKHQQKILDEAPDKCGLWMEPRTGKTPLSIRLACAKVKSCLLIVPNHIKEQWQEEVETWRDTDCKFYVYSKERFRIDSISGVVNKGRRKTLLFSNKIPACKMVIIDEVHRQASNYKNKFFKTIEDYIKRYNIKYIYLLSGTPWNKNPWSVYSYGILLGKDWNYWKWITTFFIQVKYGPRSFYKPNEKMFPQLITLLQKIGITQKLKDITGKIDDYYEVENFDLNTEQKRLIKEVVDSTPMARYVKYHQLEQGCLKSDGYTEELIFDCEKDTRVSELIDDNPKLIIVCRYLNQIQKYEQLAQEKNRRFYTIRGGQKLSAPEVAKRANADENAIVFIQADCSDGYDLQSFSVMVFVSMAYSFISYKQIKDRMKSMKKKEPCQYIHMLTRGSKSIDQGIYKSIKAGQDFSDKVFKYA